MKTVIIITTILDSTFNSSIEGQVHCYTDSIYIHRVFAGEHECFQSQKRGTSVVTRWKYKIISYSQCIRSLLHLVRM